MTLTTKLAIGQRVRIIIPVSRCTTQEGVIYDYLPSRIWPWRVRPDGEFWEGEGIAFLAEELEPIAEESEVK